MESCRSCDKSFKSVLALAGHMKAHGGARDADKKHVCGWCDPAKTFKTSHALALHRKGHRGGKANGKAHSNGVKKAARRLWRVGKALNGGFHICPTCEAKAVGWMVKNDQRKINLAVTLDVQQAPV